MMKIHKYRKFLTRARRSAQYWARVAVRDFTEDLVIRLEVRGMTRAALAEQAQVSPAYVTKVLRGSENFTIETMAKLALAVGGKVRLHIADIDAATRWFDSPTASAVVTVPCIDAPNTVQLNLSARSLTTNCQVPFNLAEWDADCRAN